MTTLNRTSLISAVSQAFNVNVNSTLIQCLGLAQLALTGDITETERLAIAGFETIPSPDQAVAYKRYSYAGQLIRKAKEVLHTTEQVKELILAVNVESESSLQEFRFKAATLGKQGFFITTGASFERFIAENYTAEHKLALEALSASKAKAKPSKPVKANQQSTETATATNAAPDTVTVQSASAAAEVDSRDVQAHNALVEMMANSDIFAAAIKAASLLTGDQARLALVQAWKKDHAAQAAEIASLKAKLAKATAPRKSKAKPVNPAMAEAMSQATTKAIKEALAS